MNSLQNDFLKRSVADLEKLVEGVKYGGELPPDFYREAFRKLHTIKGTSQTFGFSLAAEIAHELENLLVEEKENNRDGAENLKVNLIVGLDRLIQSFQKAKGKKNQIQSLDNLCKSEKTDLLIPQNSNLAPEFLKQFSEQEKKIILSEIKKGRNIFFVNSVFEMRNFSEEFKKLREKLFEKGEIIATFPNSAVLEKDKVGFRVCFASAESLENLQVITDDFSGEIIQQEISSKDELGEILSRITAHGRDLAKKSGKEIKFEIISTRLRLPPARINLIFDIVLHLVRNAVDHAIETVEKRFIKGKNKSGTIKISVETSEKIIKITVEDDGKGIDTEKLRLKAIEKGLVSPDKILTENELIDLIYLPEFSTAETLTEISGRGVGLDAVKKMAENSDGKINVKTRRESGTAFEVILLYEK